MNVLSLERDSFCLVRGLVGMILAIGPTLSAQPISAPHDSFWVPNGPVHAMVETNGLLYIGGGFTEIAPVTGAFVPIDPPTGKIAGPFPKIFGIVSTAIPDGRGGWFVGGYFDAVGDYPRANIVHLRSDRLVDPVWNVSTDGRVAAILLVGDRLFLGGDFSQVNGETRPHLAEIHPETGQLLPLNLDLASDARVLSLTTDGSKLFLGGAFASVQGHARANLAAMDLTQNVVIDWQADCNAVEGVTLLSFAGSRLYVGGDFSVIGSSNRQWVAALEPASGRVLPWNPNPTGAIAPSGVAVRGNRVYLAGDFLRLGGIRRPALAAVDIETGSVLNWTPALTPHPVHGPGQFKAMALVNDTIYVGGIFNFGPPYMTALDVETGAVKDWNPNPANVVTLIVPGNGILYVGGWFDTFGGVRRPYLASVDIATGRPNDWTPDIRGASAGVFDLALVGDTVFAAGALEEIGGELRKGLAAFRLADASLLPFDAHLIGFPALPSRLASWGNLLFVGGDFTVAENPVKPGFSVFDIQTGERIDWNPALPGTVRTFAVGQDRLYLSGTFSELAGQVRERLGAYDLPSKNLTDWYPATDAPVEQFVFGGGRMLIGGGFTRINGQPRRFLASLDEATGELHPWRLTPAEPFQSMAMIGTLFCGVQSTGTGMAVDMFGGPDGSWAPTFVGPVPRLQATRGQFFGGGGFSRVNGRFHPALVAFPVPNAPPEVVLTAPTDRLEISLPVELELRAEATDRDGTIDRLEFRVNDQIVGSSSIAPYSFRWNPRTVGRYTITAVAIDDAGGRNFSRDIHVTALPPPQDRPPTIVLTSPQPESAIQAGSNLLVTADAVDADSRLARVEFFLQTNLVAVFTNPPYAAVLSNLVWGSYSLTARVTDEFGIQATNGPIDFRVNAPPTLAWSGRFFGNNPPGTNLPLYIIANDPDGVVRSVSYYSGTNLLGVKTNAPFVFYTGSLAPGSYTFTASAIDDLGGTAVSPPNDAFVFSIPANDSFAQRFSLATPLGQAFGTNNFASREPEEMQMQHFPPFFPGLSLWWTWQPDFTGPAYFTTRGSSFPAVLGVYTGNSLSNLTKLAHNFGEVLGPTIVPVTKGTAYQIVVDSYMRRTGAFVLKVGPAVTLQPAVEQPLGRTLRYDGPTNLTYVLQSSTNSVAWTAFKSNFYVLPSAANSASWISVHTNLPGTEQRFLKGPSQSEIEANRVLLLPQTP